MTTSENNDRDFQRELAHQLAVAEVPPVPDDLDAAVRVRLNRTLQIGHWITFLTAALPMVVATMLNPIGHLLIQTLSGRTRRSSGAPEDT